MNYLKAAAYGLLLAIPAVSSTVSAAGAIVLAKENGAICTLPVPTLPTTTVMYSLRASDISCSGANDSARTITFRDVPSATIVELYDNAPPNSATKCSRGNGGSDEFYVKLKTIKKQTTTDNIELDHLPAYGPGKIIDRGGLQMVTMQVASHLRDRLSCVQITISEAPPAP